jgi:hypothetical protein
MVTQSEPMQMQTPPRLYGAAHGDELVIWRDGERIGSFTGRQIASLTVEAAKALKEGIGNG